MMDEKYLLDLIETQNLLWETISDPCSSNKAQNLHQIREIEHILVQNGKKSYYCKICQKIHRKGKIFQNHVPHAEVYLNYPPLNYPQIDTELHTQIVGIYYTGLGAYIRALPIKTEFLLKSEPENAHDPFAVSVWHADQRLGYLPRGFNRQVFDALTDQQRVRCLFGRYRASSDSIATYFRKRSRNRFRHSDEDHIQEYRSQGDFRPERADISVFIHNPQKLRAVIEGVVELVSLGYENIATNFEHLGLEAVRILENHLDQSSDSTIKKILSLLQEKFQIETKGDQNFSLLL